jgi:SpoVK/Ycf46/Vps4 family AAA+-type ATPase
VFKKARRSAPCLLFFDTIDAVAPRTSADHFNTDVYQRILSQLLREIDNLRDVKGVKTAPDAGAIRPLKLGRLIVWVVFWAVMVVVSSSSWVRLSRSLETEVAADPNDRSFDLCRAFHL